MVSWQSSFWIKIIGDDMDGNEKEFLSFISIKKKMWVAT